VVVVSRFAPRRVGLGVFVWALAVDFLIFLGHTAPHAGISSSTGALAYWLGVGLTAAAGFWLGWRHRTGTAFLAPFVAWFLLVPFAFASDFARSGFFGGLWRGFFFLLLGGFVASAIEAGLLVLFALLGRVAVVSLGRDDSTTVILPPRTG
jgi:hypothetical protein